MSIFAPSSNNPQNKPYANITFVISPNGGKTCSNGYLHDGVNLIVGEPLGRSNPRSGETFLTLAALEKNCLYSTDDNDPEIKFSPKPDSGACPSAIPNNAQILGNPGIIFKAVGLQKSVALNQPAPLPKPPAAQPQSYPTQQQLSSAQMHVVKAYAMNKNLGLTDSEIEDTTTKNWPTLTTFASSKTANSTEWSLIAAAKCKHYRIPIESCF